MSLIEQLTAINEPTILEINILLESVQSLHKRTRKLLWLMALINIIKTCIFYF